MFAVCIFYQLTQGVCVSVLIKNQVSQGPEYCVIWYWIRLKAYLWKNPRLWKIRGLNSDILGYFWRPLRGQMKIVVCSSSPILLRMYMGVLIKNQVSQSPEYCAVWCWIWTKTSILAKIGEFRYLRALLTPPWGAKWTFWFVLFLPSCLGCMWVCVDKKSGLSEPWILCNLMLN